MMAQHGTSGLALQVVWEDQHNGKDTVGSFNDFFSEPVVPLGPWPSGYTGSDSSQMGCTYHYVAEFSLQVANDEQWWER